MTTGQWVRAWPYEYDDQSWITCKKQSRIFVKYDVVSKHYDMIESKKRSRVFNWFAWVCVMSAEFIKVRPHYICDMCSRIHVIHLEISKNVDSKMPHKNYATFGASIVHHGIPLWVPIGTYHPTYHVISFAMCVSDDFMSYSEQLSLW